MNNVYEVILSNLMKIENAEDPILRMIIYAKISGIVEYAFVKEDIEEEEAEEFMQVLLKAVKSYIDQINS